MVISVPLDSLEPKWLGHDEKPEGISIRCPAHPKDESDRLEFWFLNPAHFEQGQKHVPRRWPLYEHTGDELGELTVWPAGQSFDPLINVEKHWRGYLLDGRAYDAIRMPW